MVELTPEGNMCYDFFIMISQSSRDYSYIHGLEKLHENLLKAKIENKIEPIFIFNGVKISWSQFTTCYYCNDEPGNYVDPSEPDYDDYIDPHEESLDSIWNELVSYNHYLLTDM